MADTDAIFENVDAAREKYRDDPKTLEIRLIYYPPYHSKYNPIERCWSSLQKKWNGVLLTCWGVVKVCSTHDMERSAWGNRRDRRGLPDGSHRPIAEMKQLEKRLQRSEKLSKYDITIKPRNPRGK